MIHNKLSNLTDFLASDEFSFDGLAEWCPDKHKHKPIAYNSIGVLLDTIDQFCREGRFDRINLLIGKMEPDEYPTRVLLAILIATFPVRSKLSNRPRFFDRIVVVLNSRNELESLLLTPWMKTNALRS